MKYSFILCISLFYVLVIKNSFYKSANLNSLHSCNTLIKKPAGSLKFATLYIYREWQERSDIAYNIHIEDSVVCRVKNDSKCIVRLYKEGVTEVWAKTEARRSISINVEFGKEYYLKCELRLGAFVSRPNIRIVSEERGKREFNTTETLNN